MMKYKLIRKQSNYTGDQEIIVCKMDVLWIIYNKILNSNISSSIYTNNTNSIVERESKIGTEHTLTEGKC